MTNHPDWDTLNDAIDGRLSAADRARVEAHLRDCASCRTTFEALRETVREADRLPGAVTPPAALWTDIARSIEAAKVTPIAPAAAAVTRGWFVTPRRIAVAAVVLVAASSGLTAVVLRSGGPASPVDGGSGVRVLPVQWQAVERGYLGSVAELEQQLDAQRDRLSPSTIATVEQSLAAIDAAITEAREALIRDPASATLSELLASNYRQKVDLLRRATQLNAST